MQRFHQLVLIASLLTLSWFAMMALHELGHVVGALCSGGTVQQVVLHPLTISRTDVSPNPYPLLVVWLGPILGCVFPIVFWLLVPRQLSDWRRIGKFFAGFCLIANGAYISIGSIDQVGDCGVMLKHGSPIWALIVFGALTIPVGFYLWHSLGSAREFLADPSLVDEKTTWTIFAAAVLLIAVEFIFSPM